MSSSFVNSHNQLRSNPHSIVSMKNSNIVNSNLNNCSKDTLIRSKSQLIQPIYFYNYSKTQKQSLNESRDLASSRASQITFSKPSEFIINSTISSNQKQYINSSTKIVYSTPKKCQTLSQNNLQLKPSFINSPLQNSRFIPQSQIIYGTKQPIASFVYQQPKKQPFVSPVKLKQSCHLQRATSFNNINFSNQYGYNQKINNAGMKLSNIIYDNSSPSFLSTKPSIINQASPNKFSKKLLIFNKKPAISNINSTFSTQNIYNQSNFTIGKPVYQPKLFTHRSFSNISITSKNSSRQKSGVKVNFNYISPPKSQSKTPRKLSFKRQDLKNPVSKLMKKKNTSKNQQNQPNQLNSITKTQDVVNEYFPQFKIKKNKMQKNLSPRNKMKKSNSKKQQVSLKKQQSQQNQSRRNTFIAGLQAFSQISQIKQKQQSSQFTHDSAKKSAQNKFSRFKTQYTQNSAKQSRNRQNLISQSKSRDIKTSSQKQVNQILNTESQKNSDLSLNSIKNSQQVEFSKQNQDSSHTTDEDEIVRKIKKDLGLNFSYHKK